MFRVTFTVLSISLILSSCISQFIPETNENQEIFVVEGLITNQQDICTVKLSTTMPLGLRSEAKPVRAYSVSISDNLNIIYQLSETVPGTYITYPTFRGIVGRTYTLHISSNSVNPHVYESVPMELKPVPPIDSLYYVKSKITDFGDPFIEKEGCQVYLTTNDPSNLCNYYRWEYDETWEIRIPYNVVNNTCWVTTPSDQINVKSTANLNEAKIKKYPLNFISNQSDRLKVKYSMLVRQYSINEIEYNYWDKLQMMTQQVGGLYDIIPSSVPSNVSCVSDADEKVLGFFSVSAISSKRIFVKDHFSGVANLYSNDKCIADTVEGGADIPGMGVYIWVLMENYNPPYKVITYTRGCADCTVRGSNIEPDFWRD